MSKWTKLKKNPKLFFRDAKKNLLRKFSKKIIENNMELSCYSNNTDKPKALLLYFGEYKREFYAEVLKEQYSVYSLRKSIANQRKIKEADLLSFILKNKFSAVISWSRLAKESLVNKLRDHSVTVYSVEDAFIRSIFLADSYTNPISYIMDDLGIYFDARKESRLEEILKNHVFTNDEVDRAKKCIEQIITKNTTKYNFDGSADSIYPKKTKRRVLVIGQVEDDESIKYGCNRELDNNMLVCLASQENPDAEIIYKPHPDVLFGHRKQKSDPILMEGISMVLYQPCGLPQALNTIDHVYTISSLSGFEALLRGIPVTTLGCPFYSGWGLTDDRQYNSRRGRKLSIEEVFYAAYILYSRYYNPWLQKHIEVEEAIELVDWMKDSRVFSIKPLPSYNYKKLADKAKEALFKKDYQKAVDFSSFIISGSGEADGHYYRAIANYNLKKDFYIIKIDFDRCNALTNYNNINYLMGYADFLFYTGIDNAKLVLILEKLFSHREKLSKESHIKCLVYFLSTGNYLLARTFMEMKKLDYSKYYLDIISPFLSNENLKKQLSVISRTNNRIRNLDGNIRYYDISKGEVISCEEGVHIGFGTYSQILSECVKGATFDYYVVVYDNYIEGRKNDVLGVSSLSDLIDKGRVSIIPYAFYQKCQGSYYSYIDVFSSFMNSSL